jgi:FkbM family methyltransferase
MKKRHKILRHFLKSSPYEMVEKQRRLPDATFENIKLVLALYSISYRNPIFVQIGAFDGQTADPAFEFVLAGKMKCLLVEPIETSFQKLKKMYEGRPNVHLIQAAVSDTDGEATMYKVRQGSRSESIPRGGLASFDKTHLIRHAIPERDIEQVRVPCLTLKSLLAKFNLLRIDILQIDTEGFDAEVVRMALTLDHIPSCINFEYTNLNLETKTALYDSLTKRGYFFSHDKANTLALHGRLTEEMLALSQGIKSLPVDF